MKNAGTREESIDLDLQPGDQVYRTNPGDDLSSGYYTVLEIVTEDGKVSRRDDMVVITNDAGSVAEVFAQEIVKAEAGKFGGTAS